MHAQADPNVLVVGATAIDVKGWATRPLAPGTPIPGKVRIAPGGVARNVAENLARLGISTYFLSAVGEDEFGSTALNAAAACGVDVSDVYIAAEARTAAYLSVLDDRGIPRWAVSDMDVTRYITPDYLYRHRRWFRDADWIVVDANLEGQAMSALFRLAEQYHVPVGADPTSATLAPRLAPWMSKLAMITPNEAEATALCGQPVTNREEALRAAQYLVTQGVRLAIVTLAEAGLCYATPSESGHVPAIYCHVVDYTGAGDAFSAGVVFGMLNDFPVDEAVRLGASAATLTLKCEDTVCPEMNLEQLYDQLVI
ncbi:MAG: ribokinase [Chloroflexi bacterium]|nr:ribokinase [Chloroflexota bacterium]